MRGLIFVQKRSIFGCFFFLRIQLTIYLAWGSGCKLWLNSEKVKEVDRDILSTNMAAGDDFRII